ncbi:MAG: hypothetical protein WBX27_17440, partial [Specibacter sp.]
TEPGPGTELQAAPEPPSKKRLWLGLGAGGVLAAAVVVAVVLFANLGAPKPAEPDAGKTGTPAPVVVAGAEVPAITKLHAEAGNGGANWSWSNPKPEKGDSYLWAAVSAVDTGSFKPVAAPAIFIANGANNVSCISVKLVRASGQSSEETRKCFP